MMRNLPFELIREFLSIRVVKVAEDDGGTAS